METILDVYVTMYGWSDNDPPGPAIAYPGQALHMQAGGIGTFDDPLTFASDQRDLPIGTKIYVPYLKKYFIMEDYCENAVRSTTDMVQVDLWAGGHKGMTAAEVQKMTLVQYSHTRDSAEIIRDPKVGYPVDLSPFYDDDPQSRVVILGRSDDKVYGTAWDDLINGAAGDDWVSGNAGNDSVNGGSGNDTLYGSSGRDVFVFDSKLGTSRTDRMVNFDKIADFSVRDDSIWLDNAVFKKLGAGSLTKPGKLNDDFFALGSAAQDATDYLIYNSRSGVLSYDRDGVGGAKAVEFAQLTTNLKITSKDFLLI